MRVRLSVKNAGELPSKVWPAKLLRAAREASRVRDQNALADFEGDPNGRGVLLLLHHPRYSNSEVTVDEP